jgi:DNA-binding HxlR family transcriptional regulator
MKRDMDLVRSMLLKIEDHTGFGYVDFRDGKLSNDVIYYHLKLLEEDGLIKGQMFTDSGEAYGKELTMKGHDFLDNIRSDTVWNAVKNQAGPAFGTVSLGIMAEMAKTYIKSQLGIP